MYDAKILADSIGPHAIRLTTFQVTFPRFILAEVNTHRVCSRNSASSRAIPPEKQIIRVLEDPFVPEFNSRVKGMGVGEVLVTEDQQAAQKIWTEARDDAVMHAERLLKLDVDKSRVNRLLEPFMWHTAIISATTWENFLALRTDKNAQKEFQVIAKMMQELLATQKPVELNYGEVHAPMTEDLDDDSNQMVRMIASAGRVARVSFDTHGRYEPIDESIARAESLTKNGHWSPFEHQAICRSESIQSGNFVGWKQFRKGFSNEDNFAKLKREQHALL